MSKERTISGWKAYDHNMQCKNKKIYEVGKVYEEKEAVICKKGIHYCENPMDLMAHKYIIDDSGELMAITKVEDLDPDGGDKKVEGNTSKRCTKKLKIGAKVNFAEWVRAAVKFEIDSVKKSNVVNLSNGNNSQLASSGYYSKLAASGYYSQLASSGNHSQLASSGDNSRLAASGDNSRLAASGNYSKLAASGDNSRLASSGNHSQLASSGDNSRLAASGDSSQLASSGNNSKLAASGYYSKLAASGDNSVVAAIGENSIAKASKGSWITLSEYENCIPICVKTERVDGKRIKENTFYKLKNGEFTEVYLSKNSED